MKGGAEKTMLKHNAQIYLDELIERYRLPIACSEAVQKAAEALARCFSGGHRLFTCGNGGMASDAQHVVGELMKAFVLPRRLSLREQENLRAQDETMGDLLAKRLQQALPAHSLVGENALLTAFANDVDPDMAFAQEVYGWGRPGDVLMAMSTSGNSKNVLYAVTAARARKMTTIGVTGANGGKLAVCADVLIALPEKTTHKIQELNLPVYHALCLALEEHFFGA